ncbi:MAG TPA: hypothetical protein VLD36_21755 [Burkholderiales bacterium]|nr:hypothetical protein [Burkholderiales bacterium]
MSTPIRPNTRGPCIRIDGPTTSKVRTIISRDFFSPEGSFIVRFETPPIESGEFPRPFVQPLPPAPPVPTPYSITYFQEDGMALPYYIASNPSDCQSPHAKRFNFGMANAKHHRYAVISYALIGSYTKPTFCTSPPPPAPPCVATRKPPMSADSS